MYITTRLQVFGSMTYYPLHVDSLWIGVRNLKGSAITYQDYLSNPWVTDPTYSVINRHTLALKNICQIPLKELLWPQISWSYVLWSTNGTHYLNPMRYQSVSIENTYSHQPSSTMTQSIRIYDHFRVLPIGQSLLMILA